MLERGQGHDARPLFERTLSVSPNSTEAYYGLGRIAFEEGYQAEAVRWLTLGLRYNPYHHDTLQLLDRLQRRRSS